MPPPAAVMPIQDPMIDSHEQRIQRLEAEISEVKGTVEGLAVTAEHTQKAVDRIETGVDKTNAAIDTLKEALQQTKADTEKGLQQIHADDQLAEAERKTEEVEKRAVWNTALAFLKKAALPLAVAGTAAITKLGEAMWEWVTHLPPPPH